MTRNYLLLGSGLLCCRLLRSGLSDLLGSRLPFGSVLHSLISRGVGSLLGLGSSGFLGLLHGLWLLSQFERASGSNTLDLLESARGDSLLDCCFCVCSDRFHSNLVIGEDLLLDGRGRSPSCISGQ